MVFTLALLDVICGTTSFFLLQQIIHDYKLFCMVFTLALLDVICGTTSFFLLQQIIHDYKLFLWCSF